MIKIENVSKRYLINKKTRSYFTSLDQINLEIADNAAVAIIGTSGAGKSTLLRMINGLVKPTEGDIYVDSVNINQLTKPQLNKLRAQMGMVFQNFNLLSSLTVYQNIKLALDIVGYPEDKKDSRIKEVLKLVRLDTKANRYPSSLSGGEAQRVAIGRAIANFPKYLLCDEVTSALDHKTALEIIEVLNQIKEETNTTIIFITHQIEMARRLCSSLVLIDGGKIIEAGSTKQLFIDPKSSFAKELINNVLELPIISSNNTYRLVYDSTLVSETILSDVIKKYQINTNIIDAKTIDILNEQIGYLTIQISGSNTIDALGELKSKNVEVRAC